MGNRKQPFGYQMQFGTVVVQPQEAGLVQYIFQQYILGASFQELVSALRNQTVPYDSGKLWNKNMVARILENERSRKSIFKLRELCYTEGHGQDNTNRLL